MRIVIVGGGKVGYYLCKSLIEHNHEIHLIEKNKDRCAYLANDLDITVINGDGTSLETLAAAKISKSDALAAVTGFDEANMICCQLAKMQFHVPKTICRSNNPKNVSIMKSLGIDIPVSSTALISNLIEQEIDTTSLHLLTNIKGKGVISQFKVQIDSFVNSLSLSKINLPRETLIIAIIRNHKMIIPNGDFMIFAGDELITVSSNENHKSLIKVLSTKVKK